MCAAEDMTNKTVNAIRHRVSAALDTGKTVVEAA